MTKKKLRSLLVSYWDGSISSQDYEELVGFLHENSDDAEVGLVMEEVAEWVERDQQVNIPTETMYAHILGDSRYKAGLSRPKQRTVIWRKWAYAAAIAAAVMLPVLIYFERSTGLKMAVENIRVAEVIDSASSVFPGYKQATLMLADGSVIPMDSLEGRVVTTGDGIQLSMKNGQLTYEMDHAVEEPVMNTISAPLGGEYQVMLSDGTEIWLNAASSITYPIAFVGNVREVKISGEVYFEVRRNEEQEFVVYVDDTRIKVLGTHFNVNAYDDEPTVRTTLLEGSVRIEKGKETRLLKPGQQAETAADRNEIAVKQVDVEEAVAWKNGYFLFNNEHVTNAMRRIGRWYNVDIQYEGSVPRKGLDGTISKMEDIHQLLNALEITGVAKFELKERRIMVRE